MPCVFPHISERGGVSSRERTAVIACAGASPFDMLGPGARAPPLRCGRVGGGGGASERARAAVAVKYVIIDLLFFHATNALPVLPVAAASRHSVCLCV